MFAHQYIDNSFPYLKSSDTIDFALQLMEKNGAHIFPVTKNGKYIGMAIEDILFETPITDAPLSSIDLPYENLFCGEMDHFLLAIKMMGKYGLPILPIIGEKKKFKGTITSQQLIALYSQNFSIQDPGGIVVVQLEMRDYSLTEISKIVESDGGLILNAFVDNIPNSSKILVTIKINKTDISAIIQSLERYNYEIIASFNKSIQDEQLKERLDALFAYLNV